MDTVELALRGSVPQVNVTAEMRDAIDQMVDHVATDVAQSRWAVLRRTVQRHRAATLAAIVVTLGLVPTAALAIPAIFPGQQWTNELQISVPVDSQGGLQLSCDLAVTYQPLRAIPSELERMDLFLQSLPWSDMAQKAFDDVRSDGGAIANGQGSFEGLLSQDLSARMSQAGLSWREGKIVSTGECTGRTDG